MQMNSILQLLWIFPIYSIFGWLLEVIYCSITTGKFVNRGFLNGFVCPIYGLGACMMILALTPEQHNLPLLFLGALMFGSLLELVGGFLLLHIFHIRWWDYSGRSFNIGGYVCLKFSIAWGVIGIVLLHVVNPPIAYLIGHIPSVVLVAFLITFYIYFVVDMIVTVLAVKQLSRDLEEITRLAARIRKGSDFIAEEVGTSAIQAAQRIEGSEFAERSKVIKQRVHTAREDTRAKIQVKLEDFERLNALLNDRGRIRSRLIEAFPNMKSMRDGGAFQEMKLSIRNRGQRK